MIMWVSCLRWGLGPVAASCELLGCCLGSCLAGGAGPGQVYQLLDQMLVHAGRSASFSTDLEPGFLGGAPPWGQSLGKAPSNFDLVMGLIICLIMC